MIHSQTVLFSPLFILLLLYSLGLPFPSSLVQNPSLHARVQKTATRRGEPVVLCVSDRLTLVVWRSSNCRFSVTYYSKATGSFLLRRPTRLVRVLLTAWDLSCSAHFRIYFNSSWFQGGPVRIFRSVFAVSSNSGSVLKVCYVSLFFMCSCSLLYCSFLELSSHYPFIPNPLR